ncbi:hypothetical protein LPJ56_000672 [Coemansia sp. RSA 2599]|nr:hypothetical protein LPJ75_000348 [Coemansia sp. RSA 2598]KAJ1829072.1 hypothetical protein LPJ56_000672 [Coemansia sp. RSA 2599]
MEEDSHLEHLQDIQSRVREWQPWTRTLAEVSDNLGVDPSRGLDRLEAHNRHVRFGANVPVDLGNQLSIFSVLIEESTEPMMLLLLSVGALYSLWGEPWDAATIFAAIAAVIGLEAFTEWRAKGALASLKNTLPTNTTVLRDGCETIAAADDLVVGDVVMLSHGQSVPADAVVAACHGFAVDESILTGESMPVYKTNLLSATQDAPTDSQQYGESRSDNNNNGGTSEQQDGSNIGDGSGSDVDWIPRCLVCAGTTVSAGRAVCVVVATGAHTRIASSIAGLMRGNKPPPTPLQLRMGRLASTLSVVAIAMCTAVAGIGLLQGMEWRKALIMGMSLAFATIPEELPLIAKASLALVSRSLARHKLLVRKLAAADALSSVSVIVTDKTGTLTRNQLIVSSILTVGSAEPGDDSSLSVEVVTPEAIATNERSAMLATPLYAAWSLSVDPLESRPLARRLSSIRRKLAARNSPSYLGAMIRDSPSSASHMPAAEPVRGFGKDFMNSAVLNSLPGGDSKDADVDGCGLPQDPETQTVPVKIIADAITAICQKLTEPTGELPFDATMRVSARTRSVAEPPKSFASPRVAERADAERALSEPSLCPQIVAALKHWTVIKGAPETLLPRCTRVWRSTNAGVSLSGESIANGAVDGIEAMTASFMQTLTRSATDIAVGGSRLIAYAVAITDEPLFSESREANRSLSEASDGPATLDIVRGGRPATLVLPSDLVFVGAFAFYDPPQREARPVIQECQDAGIRVILATGDHPSTALAVASAVGISEYPHQSAYGALLRPGIGPAGHLAAPALASAAAAAGTALSSTGGSPALVSSSEVHAITGEMVQRSLGSGDFTQLIDESNVFARVTPAQKLRLVHALQARGDVVAFIGDGINDAPSLMRADVGICMGGNPSTADVAMDSASMVVLSGRFSGVVRSLREGRRLGANVEKCMTFYMSCKVALVFLFLFLLVVEGTSPLTPVQVIFIELFADLGATWTFLTERPEGIQCGAEESDISLTALLRVSSDCEQRQAQGDGESGFLGGSKEADRAVAFYSIVLFVACILPLVVPSVLLPSWAMAPVAPTLTFFTWMLAHSLLGMTMRTQLVPLRIHDSCRRKTQSSRGFGRHAREACTQQWQRSSGDSVGVGRSGKAGFWARANVPGLVWVASSLAAVVLATAIPAVGAHLGVVALNGIEWAMVVVSPIVLFCVLELKKEIRYQRRLRIWKRGNDNESGDEQRRLVD